MVPPLSFDNPYFALKREWHKLLHAILIFMEVKSMANEKRQYDGMNFDPVDYYRVHLKTRVKEIATTYFDTLLKASKVDEGTNQEQYTKLQSLRATDNAEDKRRGRWKGFRTFLWVIFGIGLFFAIIGIITLFSEGSALAGGLMTGLGLLAVVVSLVLIFVWLKNKIAVMEAEDKERNAAIAQLESNIRQSLEPLYSKFSWNDFKKIVSKTTDMFTIDEKFPEKKMDMLRSLYNYSDVVDPNESIVALMSGDIDTNPYVRVRIKREEETIYTYTGSMVITWVEHYTDSDGHVHSRTRTQTLVAQYRHPGPMFSSYPMMIYGNNAAPDLDFSRGPVKVDTDDEKALKKYIKRNDKILQEEMEKGSKVQAMANSEFEALFNCKNRDNEVQFRLLFTPLAQQNMIELIKGKEGYGDDFYYMKRKKINIVQCSHSYDVFSYNFNFSQNYLCVKDMRNYFISNICDLFKSLYFDLAPILSIPLYQMTEAGAYTPDHPLPNDISVYEAMKVSNNMPASAFKNANATTDQILRPTYEKTVGSTDIFKVHSIAFRAIRKVAYVPTMGGDGYMHNVPVPYDEYIPADNDVTIGIKRTDTEKNGLSQGLYNFLSAHGGSQVDTFSGFRAEDFDEAMDQKLDGFVKKLDDDDPFGLEKALDKLDSSLN